MRANWGSAFWRARCVRVSTARKIVRSSTPSWPTESGEPREIPGAVGAIRAGRRHRVEARGQDPPRARPGALFLSSEAGNYDYGFEWIFHQNGTLEMRVLLTGIMSVKAVADGAHDPYSHMVGQNLAAVHHQHFFCFRLDMDVDGQANRVVEMNSAAVPAGKQNPYGGAFTMQETPLTTELKAQRRINLETQPAVDRDESSGEECAGAADWVCAAAGGKRRPVRAAGAWVRKRAGFLNAHIWVTPYNRGGEVRGGRLSVSESKGGDGLPKWTAANRHDRQSRRGAVVHDGDHPQSAAGGLAGDAGA